MTRHLESHRAKSSTIRTMKDQIIEIWNMLIGRTDGPLTFRFAFQPTVAALLAIRAGLRDARKGASPFIWSLFKDPPRRPELLREVWKDVGTVFMVAVLLDVIYALIVHSWIFPGQTLLVATLLAIIPYVFIRGPVTRLIVRFARK